MTSKREIVGEKNAMENAALYRVLSDSSASINWGNLGLISVIHWCA